MKTKLIAFISITGSIIPFVASANPVCNSINQCEQLIRDARAKLQILQATPNLTPAVRNSDGRASRMYFHDAETYCAGQGGRLPTVREAILALNPQAMHQEKPAGLITVKIDPINEDPFFYDQSAYGRSDQQEDGLANFWTSSIAPDPYQLSPRVASPANYTFEQTLGSLFQAERADIYSRSLVRCIINK